MGRRCFVPGCHSGNCKDNVVLFKVPKDEEILRIWRNSIGRTDRILTHSHHVCERHFEDHYIVKRRIETFGGIVLYDVPVRAQLTEGAVPTIFPYQLQCLPKSEASENLHQIDLNSLVPAKNNSLKETDPDEVIGDNITSVSSPKLKSSLWPKDKAEGLRYQKKDRFPLKRPDVLSKWVKVLERGNWKPTNYSRLCSLHFNDNDYDTRFRTKKLKDDAVPSIFNIPDKLQGLLRKMRSQQITVSPKSVKLKAKSENTPEDLPYFGVVKQEPSDDASQHFLSSENTPASQFSNTFTYSLNGNNTVALENSFPNDISSSAALTAIPKSSSTLYASAISTEPSNLSVNPSTSSVEINDAFSAFGEFVAKKIGSFTDQNLQVEAQQQIMNMLFEMEMKHSTKNNLPVLNSISSLKTGSSDIAILPSSIVYISSNSNNIVAFNAVL